MSPARSVYLHIGEPKTGTTYLQQIMWTNRGQLREHGVLVPGKRPVDHWAAAQDLRQIEQRTNDPFGSYAGHWDRLVGEARRAPRAAVISHELVCGVDAAQAARAVESLRAADVHVVLTVRDMATLLPAEWQETVKHRNARAWREWLSAVIDEESVAPDRRRWLFWQMHDTLEILRLWSVLIPPDRIHVITVPSRRADTDVLWRRFAGVIGVPADAVDLALTHRNTALSVAETEFLRRLNAAVPEQIPNWLYVRAVKDGVAHTISEARGKPPADRLYLPEDRDEWVGKYAEALVAELGQSPYDLVGDLAELLPPELPDVRPDPEETGAERIAEAGVAAAVQLVAQVAAHQGVVLTDGVELAPPGEPGPVKRRLIALSNRIPLMHRLRRGYWHLANAVRRLRRGDPWRAVEDRYLR